MNEEKSMDTKGQRREAKRRKHRRMKATGAGLKRLQAVILRRSEKASNSGESGD